jgi:deferrochelatase/peroxidase EfeB
MQEDPPSATAEASAADGCPHHGGDDADRTDGDGDGGHDASGSAGGDGSAAATDPPERGVSRRAFGKAAVAIGGATALSACLDRFGDGAVPSGVEDPGTLPDGQHVWDEFLGLDDHDNRLSPRHHVVLLVDLTSEGVPSAEDRETVETALRSLERAYEWSTDGLLFTIGYAPRYFERFDADPDGVALPEPEPMAPFEDIEPDRPDAVLHLASDRPDVVMEAEEALFGEVDAANGRGMDATLEGVFARPDLEDTTARRTGFVGEGLPADHTDVDGVPEDAPVDEESPLFMNFKSGFEKTQATESFVTIESGGFAGGTTQHLSKIRLNLQQWYEQDNRDQRVGKMFCPFHAEQDRVEGPGHNLGTDSGMDDECTEDVEASAREHGLVGHSQKMAAEAREDDSPLMLRRDFDSTDDGHAGLHFLSVQESIEDFVDTREAMNGTDLAENSGVGRRLNNGILQYISVQRRGNYLLPPRDHRALPPAEP